jgi:flagellar protein FliS
MDKVKQAYLQTQVSTTTPGQLVVMLYDGAIKFLNQAKERMAEKNYAEKGILISRTLDIIAELDSSLNMEKGGKISQNLHSLYIYSQNKLLQANLKVSPEMVDEVLNILTPLRNAFAEIVNKPEAIAAQQVAANKAAASFSAARRPIFDTGMFGQNTGTSSFTRTRAYQQQSMDFGSASLNANKQTVVPTPQVSQQKQIPQVNFEVPEASLSPKPEVKIVAQTKSQVQSNTAAALTGFARQMINNSLYRKMSISPQVEG